VLFCLPSRQEIQAAEIAGSLPAWVQVCNVLGTHLGGSNEAFLCQKKRRNES